MCLVHVVADECEQPVMSRGHCSSHYQRFHKAGVLGEKQGSEPWKQGVHRGAVREKTVAKGHFFRHYHQIRSHGRLTPEVEYRVAHA